MTEQQKKNLAVYFMGCAVILLMPFVILQARELIPLLAGSLFGAVLIVMSLKETKESSHVDATTIDEANLQQLDDWLSDYFIQVRYFAMKDDILKWQVMDVSDISKEATFDWFEHGEDAYNYAIELSNRQS